MTYKNKSKISTIAIITILAVSTILFALPVATAQLTVNPYPYINVVPDVVQVGVNVVFHVGSVYPVPTSMGGWSDLSVEITKPDGTTESITGIMTDTTGGTGVSYVPTLVGTYSVRTLFPETVTPVASGRWGPAGTIMEETYTDPVEFVAQEDPRPRYSPPPLPTEYWVRPIPGEAREWYTIGGYHIHSNEPTSSATPDIVKPFNDYAPESSHILFRTPLATQGGLAGGAMGVQGFEQGDAYEERFHGTIIMGGVLFRNDFEDSYGPEPIELPVVATDLHTGKELWRRELVGINGEADKVDFGQMFYWDSYNTHAVMSYLWTTSGSTWNAFDPATGRWEYAMTNVPSGVNMDGPKGEILRYYISTNNGRVHLWNSSRVIGNAGSWRPQGEIYNCSYDSPRNGGMEWNMTLDWVADDLPGSAYKYRDQMILGTNFQRGSISTDDVSMWLLSFDYTDGVSLVWNKTWAVPNGRMHITVEDVSLVEDLFIVSSKETRQTWGFRLSTGTEIWGPTPMRFYTDNWGHSSGNSWDIIAYGDGKVIAGNYGGTVWCYDAADGAVLWTFDIVDPYVETLHNNRWRFRPAAVADGKLYIENTEHNPRDPQPRGAPYICLNLTTGEELWRLPYRQGEWSSYAIMGDSIAVLQNTYDQHVYVVGKGPSQTTLEVETNGIPLGSLAVVSGTVMDVSPGTEDPTIALRFPAGVPAIADENMDSWMTYVYNQFARPTDITGVEVRIQTVDPNGNYAWIGTVTSDPWGNYEYSFIPQMKGTYIVFASFVGSNSYYPSEQSAYLTVGDAPAPYPTIPSYPGYQGPSAQDVANRVVSSLPSDPTPDQIGQAVVNQLPEYPEPTVVPEYTMIDIVLIVLVAIAIVLCIIILMRKK